MTVACAEAALRSDGAFAAAGEAARAAIASRGQCEEAGEQQVDLHGLSATEARVAVLSVLSSLQARFCARVHQMQVMLFRMCDCWQGFRCSFSLTEITATVANSARVEQLPCVWRASCIGLLSVVLCTARPACTGMQA